MSLNQMTQWMLPSVTAIVDRVFPFPDFVRDKWVKSMSAKAGRDITYEELMDVAQRGGTYLHDYARQVCGGMPMFDAPPEHYAPFCDGIWHFLHDRKVEMILAERKVVKSGEYYWHIDLFCSMEYNGERIKVLVDFKSYGLTNILLGIKEDMDKKDISSNKKKVQLQLSLYRDALQETFPEYQGETIYLMCIWVAKGRCEIIMLPYDSKQYDNYKLMSHNPNANEDKQD